MSDDVFDKMADSYAELQDIPSVFQQRIKYDLAIKYVKPDFKVLDIGCANGFYMKALAGHCAFITGIDINDKMLALAEENMRTNGISNYTLMKKSAARWYIVCRKDDLSSGNQESLH